MVTTERERLVTAICDSARRCFPLLRIDSFHRMKERLMETRIEVLREILEEDLFTVDAGSPAAAATAELRKFAIDSWRPGAREVLQ